MANWATTKVRRSGMPPTVAAVILFFRAKTGLNPDTINAGYKPDNMIIENVAHIKKHEGADIK